MVPPLKESPAQERTERSGLLPPPFYQPVTFLTREVPPPTSVYVDEEDFLHIRYFCEMADWIVDLHGRFLSLEGEIKPFTHTFKTVASVDFTHHIFDLEAGYLLSCYALARNESCYRGRLFMAVSIAKQRVIPRITAYLLFQGYVAVGETLGWPPGKIETGREPPGWLTDINIQNPAAGANLYFTFPPYQLWKIGGIRFGFVTSATVADRQVVLVILGEAGNIFESEPAPVQTASLTRSYYFIPGWPTRETAFDSRGVIRLPLPLDLVLRTGNSITTAIINLQAADDIGPVGVRKEQWLHLYQSGYGY